MSLYVLGLAVFFSLGLDISYCFNQDIISLRPYFPHSPTPSLDHTPTTPQSHYPSLDTNGFLTRSSPPAPFPFRYNLHVPCAAGNALNHPPPPSNTQLPTTLSPSYHTMNFPAHSHQLLTPAISPKNPKSLVPHPRSEDVSRCKNTADGTTCTNSVSTVTCTLWRGRIYRESAVDSLSAS